MNSLNFTGRVGRDADTRFTPSGDAIVGFSVALTSGYGDKVITTWLNCSMSGKRGEAVAQYIKKGTQVGITGEFTARPYTSKDGVEKLSLDVRVNDLTLLSSKNDSVHDSRTDNKNEQRSKADTSNANEQDFESDIPF